MKKTFRTRLTALLICVVFLPSNVYGLGAKAFIAEEYTDSSIADEYEDSAIENEYVDFSMDDYADSSADMSKVNSVGTFEPILEDAVEAIAVSGTSLKDAYVSDSPALPRKLIVKYKDDVSEAMAEVSARKIAREFSIDNPEQISMDGSSRLEVFSFEKAAESELDTESLIMDLQTDPNVEYVQEDFLFTPLSSPGDPDFDMQWGLKNIGQDIDGAGGTAGADINVTDVWDELAPQSGVVVGLLDTGVDIDHPDLQDIVVEGYDFTGPESNILPLDGDPHGTQIAGIIAAKHNLEGIAGAAPNVSIMPLKFIENGAGYTSDALNAIEYAKLNGIRVINCSWGSTFYNRALYEAISDNPHILFVCSAGNIDGGQPIYPAAFGLSNILAVSSADNKGLADINASHGDYVNLYAPGVNIYTAMPDGGYDFVSGTSMSAGFVSAAAAIYLQYYPGALGRDIAAAVRQSVSYRGEDEPVTPIAAGTNAPLLNVGAMLDIPPGAELPASTEYTSSLPDGFDLSEYYTPYGDQIEYIQDLMSSNQLYTDLSDEEIETLNLCLSVTDEAMTECADGGFGIYDAYVKAKIMCYTDSSLADVLTMIDNYGGDEEAAALQAYIFDFYRLKHPELFEADESGGLTALLIGGYTANEIGNAFIFSEVLEIFIEEAINWIDEIRSSAPPEFQYDSSGYDSYLIDKLLWDYGIGQRRIALNAF
ncbi:MAG: S8 family serine peptidase, partial [Clostridiales Family XIII bacterium]|nr:S8 family serine peptidase [Clostridiales Family XIII bacterium]